MKRQIREVATGTVIERWPVDAAEAVASGSYVYHNPPPPAPGGPPADQVAARAAELSAMTLAQLIELAAKNGLTVPEGAVKKDLVTLIAAAEFSPGDPPAPPPPQKTEGGSTPPAG